MRQSYIVCSIIYLSYIIKGIIKGKGTLSLLNSTPHHVFIVY